RQYFGFSASGTSLPGGPFEQLIGDLHHFDRHASSCVEGLARSGLFKKRAARGGSSCGAPGVADDGGVEVRSTRLAPIKAPTRPPEPGVTARRSARLPLLL